MTAPTCLITFISKIKALKLTTKIAVIIAATVIAGGVMTTIVLLNSHDEQLHEISTTNIRQEELEETEELPFETIEEKDGTKLEGTTEVKQEGQNGVLTRKFLITYDGDIEVAREKISETITTEPVPRITVIGTKKPIAMVKPNTSNAAQPTQDCSLPTGWGRPDSCPPETRSDFTAKGGWERVARMTRQRALNYQDYPSYDPTGSFIRQGELCFGEITIKVDTLEIIEAHWDDSPTSTCDYVRNDHPSIPSIEYLNHYLETL